MGLLLSIARKFKEYTITVLTNESNTSLRDSKPIIAWEHETGDMAMSSNSNPYEVLELRTLAWNGIVEAMTNPNINLVGVYGTDSSEKATLLEKVSRKAVRDKLFEGVMMAIVTKKPELKKIQEQLSEMMGIKFEEKKDVAERTHCLCDKIKEQHRIFVVLCDLWKRIYLGKVGIPFGEDHKGCKILLTSTSEEVLSNEMHTQKNCNV